MGVGAYKITGGSSGGWLEFHAMITLFALAIGLGLFAFSGTGLLVAGWGVVNFDAWLESLKSANTPEEFKRNNAATAAALLIGFLGLQNFGGQAIGVWIFAEGMAFLMGLI